MGYRDCEDILGCQDMSCVLQQDTGNDVFVMGYNKSYLMVGMQGQWNDTFLPGYKGGEQFNCLVKWTLPPDLSTAHLTLVHRNLVVILGQHFSLVNTLQSAHTQKSFQW